MDHGRRQRHEDAAITVSFAFVFVLVFACGPLPARATGPGARSFDFSHLNLDLAVSSDYVVHGVTRSQGNPIVQAQLGWTGDSGWSAGAWLSTIDLNPGRGPTREIDPYVGKRWMLGRDWSLRSDLTRYLFRPRLQGVAYDYTELRGALSFRDVLEIAIGFAPDYSGYSWRGPARDRTMLTYEASAHFPATRWLSLNAGAGRRDLQDAFGVSYWYWSAGTETSFDRVSFALSYIGTSHAAVDLYGSEYAGDRMVATVAVRLR
jgi:uncharacterized protein (TIGR02001 family)